MSIIRTSKVLYKDRLAFWLSNFSILAMIATWLVFLFKPIERDPLAVLHYNIYAGIDALGSWHWLYLIPLIVLFFSLLDFALAVLLWTRMRIMSYFLLVNILLINAFTFFYIYNILNYNT